MQAQPKPKPKRVFLSYDWESQEYRLWVKSFATRLRADGVEARLDAWHMAKNDNIPEFMNREIRKSDWVLVLCSPGYQDKVRAAEDGKRVSGVGWETRLLTGRMLVENENKVIAVLTHGLWRDAAPDSIMGQMYYDLSDIEKFEVNYRALLQGLTGTEESAPQLGELPTALAPDPVEPLRGMDSLNAAERSSPQELQDFGGGGGISNQPQHMFQSDDAPDLRPVSSESKGRGPQPDPFEGNAADRYSMEGLRAAVSKGWAATLSPSYARKGRLAFFALGLLALLTWFLPWLIQTFSPSSYITKDPEMSRAEVGLFRSHQTALWWCVAATFALELGVAGYFGRMGKLTPTPRYRLELSTGFSLLAAFAFLLRELSYNDLFPYMNNSLPVISGRLWMAAMYVLIAAITTIWSATALEKER